MTESTMKPYGLVSTKPLVGSHFDALAGGVRRSRNAWLDRRSGPACSQLASSSGILSPRQRAALHCSGTTIMCKDPEPDHAYFRPTRVSKCEPTHLLQVCTAARRPPVLRRRTLPRSASNTRPYSSSQPLTASMRPAATGAPRGLTLGVRWGMLATMATSPRTGHGHDRQGVRASTGVCVSRPSQRDT
jgi:hypothetical protein